MHSARQRPVLLASRRLQTLLRARRRTFHHLLSLLRSASPAEPAAVAREGRSTDANNIHGLTCPYKGRLLVVPVQNE